MAEPEGHVDDQDQLQQAAAQSERLQRALLAVLDASNAWAEPLILSHALAAVLQSSLATVVKVDPSRMPWVLGLIAQVHRHVIEAGVVPGETKH